MENKQPHAYLVGKRKEHIPDTSIMSLERLREIRELTAKYISQQVKTD